MIRLSIDIETVFSRYKELNRKLKTLISFQLLQFSLSLSPFDFSPNLSEPPFTLHLPPFYRNFPLLYPQLAYFQLVLGDTCHITFMFYHPFIKEKKRLLGVSALFKLVYQHLMWKKLGKEHLINAEVTISMIIISLWHLPRWSWWWWHLGSSRELATCEPLRVCYRKSFAYYLRQLGASIVVVRLDLHGISFGELLFTSQASSFPPSPLGQAHLLRLDLLGFWPLAWV